MFSVNMGRRNNIKSSPNLNKIYLFSALGIVASTLTPAKNFNIADQAEGELLLLLFNQHLGILDRAADVLARLHRVLQGMVARWL